jgi:hypothetical protein
MHWVSSVSNQIIVRMISLVLSVAWFAGLKWAFLQLFGGIPVIDMQNPDTETGVMLIEVVDGEKVDLGEDSGFVPGC